MANDQEKNDSAAGAETKAPRTARVVDPDVPVMWKNVSRVTQQLSINQVPVVVLEGDTVMAPPSVIAKLPQPWFQRVHAK